MPAPTETGKPAVQPAGPTLQERVGNMIPDKAMPAINAINKYAVEPFEKMASKGAEYGKEAGAGWVQGASGGASGMSAVPRQAPLTSE
ncbi:MAG: hypothetical protein ABSG90_15120, partial [Dehalococcoidia bacterium]